MSQTARVLISVAWFAAISLIASAPPAQVASETPPQDGPCYVYNGVYICPW
jgi:hypothetical protein